jgi:hypothetical protein
MIDTRHPPASCFTLTRVLRGRLCQQLAGGSGRSIEPGERLYSMGQPAESVYLVRRGLVKTSLVSPGGQELTLQLYQAGDIRSVPPSGASRRWRSSRARWWRSHT